MGRAASRSHDSISVTSFAAGRLAGCRQVALDVVDRTCQTYSSSCS